MLHDGQRVCFQSWAGFKPAKADRNDRGTVEVDSDWSFVVLWDSGEADMISQHGWCKDYGYRVLPLGNVPDVAPSREQVERWWEEACGEVS